MIGIILPSGLIKQTNSVVPGSVVEFYKNLACKNAIDICFYTMKSLSLNKNTVNAVVYSYEKDEMHKEEATPIPNVNIYRTKSYLRKEKLINKINHLSMKNNIIFFNAVTNKDRSKYKIHEYLASVEETAPFLPEAANLSFEKMVQMIESFGKVYIKPKRSCKGNNIYVLEKTNSGYTMAHILKTKETITNFPQKDLLSYYSSLFKSPNRFILQQGIKSKKYKGNKFDFRVSPQKTKSGTWKVIGFYARVADKCLNVTNRDQGGRLKFRLKPLINQKIKKEIKQCCIKIAKALESKYPQVIDLGIDIAIDETGKIWLLEANFRPYRGRIDSKHHRVPFEHAVWYYNQNYVY
ncbi:YheC/YheD family protein [Salipaludibacillus sp. CF4.18]|uniref:YheC/YheD family protein n=1 Tax=Salipaludibacillus sp. CF4.18 TaxID=3373081 RepID=UPI003EE71748